MGYKILFASLILTSNQKKTKTDTQKNKKKDIKIYHQRKITFTKKDRKNEKTTKQLTNQQ